MNTRVRYETDEFPEPESPFDAWFQKNYPKFRDEYQTMKEYLHDHPELEARLKRTDEVVRKLQEQT